MRFASLGNKAETQILQKAKSNFSATQATKKKPNLHGTASLSHISFCAITTTRVEKLVKINSQIYGILLFRSLRYQFWLLLFSRRQNVEYHFTAFNSPLVDPPIFIRFVLKIPCPFFPVISAIRFIIRAVNVCIPCMCIHNLVSKEGISFTFYHCFQFHFYHHIKSRSCIYGKVRICLL